MEDLDFPICILKMNLQCCEDLPSRVKKLLRKVKGVYSIIIDPEKGLILISGVAEPPVIIKAVEKTGQSPQLYAYEKDPIEAKIQFRKLLKRYAAVKRRDEPPTKSATETCPVRGPPPKFAAETCPMGGPPPNSAAGAWPMRGPPPNSAAGAWPMRGPPPNSAAGAFPVGGPPTMMQMPMFTLPRTVGPPGWLVPEMRPKVMVKYEEPKMMTRKPPAPYPFDYYENLDFPASNSLFHYFSDDHAQPCTIT